MFKIGNQDIIGSIFTIGKMVFGGGDDDAFFSGDAEF